MATHHASGQQHQASGQPHQASGQVAAAALPLIAHLATRLADLSWLLPLEHLSAATHALESVLPATHGMRGTTGGTQQPTQHAGATVSRSFEVMRAVLWGQQGDTAAEGNREALTTRQLQRDLDLDRRMPHAAARVLAAATQGAGWTATSRLVHVLVARTGPQRPVDFRHRHSATRVGDNTPSAMAVHPSEVDLLSAAYLARALDVSRGAVSASQPQLSMMAAEHTRVLNWLAAVLEHQTTVLRENETAGGHGVTSRPLHTQCALEMLVSSCVSLRIPGAESLAAAIGSEWTIDGCV
jgi:hypothetical protein